MGFQFNTIDTQIGTRRPLVLQMINDESLETPQCKFLTEDCNQEEPNVTPVHEVEAEIRKRTEALCGKTGVSGRPSMLACS